MCHSCLKLPNTLSLASWTEKVSLGWMKHGLISQTIKGRLRNGSNICTCINFEHYWLTADLRWTFHSPSWSKSPDDTPENQRSTLSPFVTPPPLLLFTSLTDLEHQKAANWSTFWHFKYLSSFAKHCSGFVRWRPHLPHFFWLCFRDESFFFPFPFRQWELTGVFLL